VNDRELVALQRQAQHAFELEQLAAQLVHFTRVVFVQVAAIGLGAVQGGFRSDHQGLAVLAVGRIDGCPDTDADMHIEAAQFEGPPEGRQQFFANAADGLRIGNFVEQHRKTVTAQAGNDIVLAQGDLDALGGFDQHLIADRVTQRIIDQLEAVEVQLQYREAAVVALGVDQLLLKRREPGFAIGQRRQSVEGAQLIEQGFDRLLLAEVENHAGVVRHQAVRALHHSNRQQGRIDFTALAPVPDLPFPGAGERQFLPHLLVKAGILPPGLEDARMLADDFLAAVAGNPQEGRVDLDDALLGIGDQDGFDAVGENRLGQVQLPLGNATAGLDLANQDAGQHEGEEHQQGAEQQFLPGAIFLLLGAYSHSLVQAVLEHLHGVDLDAGDLEPGLRRRQRHGQQRGGRALAVRLFPQGSSLDLLPDAFCFLDVGCCSISRYWRSASGSARRVKLTRRACSVARRLLRISIRPALKL
jgi:hypothetical protein